MTIQELTIITETNLKVKWNEGLGIFQVSLKDANGSGVETIEERGSGILTSTWGSGKTKNEAIGDYCDEIAGKILVIDALRKRRREYPVPNSLCWK